MQHNQSALTQGLKADLERLWSEGHRQVVLTTFMLSATVGDREVAKWIHTRFKHEYTDAELELLGAWAAEFVVMQFAAQLARKLTAQGSVDPAQAAKDVIARAMAH